MDELRSNPEPGRVQDAAVEPRATEPAPGPPAPERPYGRAALLVALLIAAVFFFVTLAPIAAPVLLGALLAGFAVPWRNWLMRRVRRRTLVAAIITVVTLLLVLVPLGLLTAAIAERLQTLVADGGGMKQMVGPNGAWEGLLERYPTLGRLFPGRIGDQLADALRFLAGSIPHVLTGLANGVIGIFLAAITLFYLTRDGDTLFGRIERSLPLESRHTRAILREFGRVGRAFIVGTLGTAALQGTLAGIGYWALDLPEALLLAVLTGVLAVVPVGGSGLVWVPLALYLVAIGDTTKGLLLLAYGGLIVGTVDNIVRPLLSRGGLDVHPLFMFLAIFGGLAAFGVTGLYLGPLCVALFMAVAHIYEAEIAPVATAPPRNEDAETASLWRAVQALRRRRR